MNMKRFLCNFSVSFVVVDCIYWKYSMKLLLLNILNMRKKHEIKRKDELRFTYIVNRWAGAFKP